MLVVRGPDNMAVSAEALQQTADVLTRRFADAGLPEPEISAAGDRIVLEVPGDHDGRVVASLTAPAQLRFRKVVASASGLGMPPPASPTDATPSGDSARTEPGSGSGELSGSPAERMAAVRARVGERAWSAALSASGPPRDQAEMAELLGLLARFADLSAEEVAVLPARIQFVAPVTCEQLNGRQLGSVSEVDQFVVACDEAGVIKYLLDTAAVYGPHVADAESISNGGRWQVDVEFTATGQPLWTELTREAVANNGAVFDWQQLGEDNHYTGSYPIGCDLTAVGDQGSCLVAVVLDNLAISTPQILSVITGETRITGDFDSDQAALLASQLRTGATPLTLEIDGIDYLPG